jgi:acetyltransferase-like isoleucine patch superfamily enzyme
MAYLTISELESIGFKALGSNVLISDKVSIYKPERISIGNNVRIDDFCIITGMIDIGNYVHISVYSYVYGGSKGVVLEDFAGLAYGVRVFTDSDDYSGRSMTNPTIPEEYKPLKVSLPISIRKHSIVGAGSLIMPGVTLAEGSAIGALSMVTKDTDSWSIYSGVPARRLSRREKAILDLEARFLSQRT